MPRRLFPILLLLFAASGCAALIYEVVWLQLLQLVVGSSAVSIAVLLTAYMGGLCAGSYLLPRVVSPRHHPLRVYAFIELGIGVLAITVLFQVPLVRSVYVACIGVGLPGLLLRGILCGLCLLPPTLLMGASLPAMARWLESTPQGVSKLGLLYAANTAGAVLGCLAAGFYLLRVYDMPTRNLCRRCNLNTPSQPPASFVVGSRTLLAVCEAGSMGTGTRRMDHLHNHRPVRTHCARGGSRLDAPSLLYAARRNRLHVRDHTRRVSRRHRPGQCRRIGTRSLRAWRPKVARDLPIPAGRVHGMDRLDGPYTSLPYWPINPALTRNPWIDFQLDLVRCLWAILPGSTALGCELSAGARRSREVKEKIQANLPAASYAANTIGAIVQETISLSA